MRYVERRDPPGAACLTTREDSGARRFRGVPMRRASGTAPKALNDGGRRAIAVLIVEDHHQ